VAANFNSRKLGVAGYVPACYRLPKFFAILSTKIVPLRFTFSYCANKRARKPLACFRGCFQTVVETTLCLRSPYSAHAA
jgi:hypothetical protein